MTTKAKVIREYLARKARHHGGSIMGHAKQLVKPGAAGAGAYFAHDWAMTNGPDFYKSKAWAPGATMLVGAALLSRKAPRLADGIAGVGGFLLAKGLKSGSAAGLMDSSNPEAGWLTWLEQQNREAAQKAMQAAQSAAPALPAAQPAQGFDNGEAGLLELTPRSMAPSYYGSTSWLDS